jgi:hypothetical protein
MDDRNDASLRGRLFAASWRGDLEAVRTIAESKVRSDALPPIDSSA